MAQTCPISEKRTDTNIFRLISSFTSLTALLFMITGQSFFIFLLLFDFSARFFQKQNFSPFFKLSTIVLRFLPLKPKPSDDAPKRFALILGWSMVVAIVFFYLIGLDKVAFLFSAILFACALIEMLFDFCIGCKIYYFITIFKKG